METIFLLGGAVDGMFSMGSFGGLADTVCTYGLLGHVLSFIARSTRCPLAMMSTKNEQHAPFTGGASPKSD